MTTAEANIERTRRAHELFSAGDADGLMEVCGPDIEFTTFVAEMEGRVYRGPEGVREWIANVRGTFDEFSTTLLEIEAVGDDRVIAEVMVSGIASGLRIEQRVFQVVELRDGKAVRWRWHRSREDAVAAAGGTA